MRPPPPALCLLAAALAATGAKAADAELWLVAAQKVGIRPGVSLDLAESTRIRADGTGPYYYFAEAGVGLPPAGGWRLQPALRLARLKASNGRWGDEVRGLLAANRTYAHRTFTVSIRGILEYRDYSDQDDGSWLRGRVVLAPGEEWQRKFRPYASNEVFHEFDSGRIRQNRAFFGIGFPVSAAASADVYFGWRSSERAGQWRHQEILGFKMDWRF